MCHDKLVFELGPQINFIIGAPARHLPLNTESHHWCTGHNGSKPHWRPNSRMIEGSSWAMYDRRQGRGLNSYHYRPGRKVGFHWARSRSSGVRQRGITVHPLLVLPSRHSYHSHSHSNSQSSNNRTNTQKPRRRSLASRALGSLHPHHPQIQQERRFVVEDLFGGWESRGVGEEGGVECDLRSYEYSSGIIR